MEKLTKDQLMGLFQLIAEKTKNPESLETTLEDGIGLLYSIDFKKSNVLKNTINKFSDNIEKNIQIEVGTYFIRMVFNYYIVYVSYEITKEEFDMLIKIYDSSSSLLSKMKKEQEIKENEVFLEQILFFLEHE